MAGIGVLRVFCVLMIIAKDLSATIRTQPIVLVAPGVRATLNCELMQPGDVEEVEWQKILPDGKRRLASFHKQRGRKVNPVFEDKMEFTIDELRTCSVVMDVTEQNEGCYSCVFRTDSGDVLTNKTCAWSRKLDQPVLHASEPDRDDKSVVSCSATGRPAPTVTLIVTQPHLYFSHHNTVRVTNTNDTVTVTTTAVLSGYDGDSTWVRCTARVDSVPEKVESKEIPEENFGDVPHPGFPTDLNGFLLSLVGMVILLSPGILFVICFCCKKLACLYLERIWEEPEEV